ncbi:type 2 DNA topoisomerase 6 subunit B-like isoform X2 [Lepisosteus oculatus]|uniref:type 2 DNA topoisomerase 6 subunit B-like isoform X2 n=1 Tax=Lepisosteus oculatus TaxID=7918 RepID=UPI0035F51D5B
MIVSVETEARASGLRLLGNRRGSPRGHIATRPFRTESFLLKVYYYNLLLIIAAVVGKASTSCRERYIRPSVCCWCRSSDAGPGPETGRCLSWCRGGVRRAPLTASAAECQVRGHVTTDESRSRATESGGCRLVVCGGPHGRGRERGGEEAGAPRADFPGRPGGARRPPRRLPIAAAPPGVPGERQRSGRVGGLPGTGEAPAAPQPGAATGASRREELSCRAEVCLQRAPPTCSSPLPDAVFTVASCGSPAARQTLLLFLFVEHADPFQSELGDFVASAETVQQNLDPLLRYNEEAVMSAIHLLLDSALQDWLKAQKAQARLRSALPVILSSVASVVSSSACLDFRTSCFRSMKVRDTQELVASVRQSLVRVTEARFLPSHRSDHRRLPPDVAADAAAPIRGHREERGDEDEAEEEDMDAVLRSRSPEEEVPPGELDGAGRHWGTEARKPRRPGARRRASPPCTAPDQSRPSPSKRRPCPVAPALQEDEVLWLQGISSLPEWE